MNIKVFNRSSLSDESLQGVLNFLLPYYGDTPFPVQVKVYDWKWEGAQGIASWPQDRDRRGVKKGVVNVIIRIGKKRDTYPYQLSYKKSAGDQWVNSHLEEIAHLIAHELRHVEQFAACAQDLAQNTTVINPNVIFGFWFRRYERRTYRQGSSEVDAEAFAHKVLDNYRSKLEVRAA